MKPSTPTRYTCWAMSMHWIMALLIASVYLTIELHDLYPRHTRNHDLLRLWHYILGTGVFFLVWLRLVLRTTSILPATCSNLSPWESLLAKSVHFGLYLFMFGMPLLGWLIISAADRTPTFYGIKLPVYIEPNPELTAFLLDLHAWLGIAGYYLIGVHMIGALFHHYIKRDATLKSMLPEKASVPITQLLSKN